MIKPVFVFSLPRSGSTLLQRILANHENIASASEPWLLLPFFYAQKDDGLYANYSHRQYRKAFDDFCELLPNKHLDYFAQVSELAVQLYAKAAPSSATHFLDKTPRYHIISPEIIEAFPEAKFVFLWRNPLATVASIMDTWAGGKWNLDYFKIDLYEGLQTMNQAYSRAGKKVHGVRYEDLVKNRDNAWENLFEYLELPFDDEILSTFGQVELHGRQGDPTGPRVYSELSDASLDKWKSLICNPVRIRWATNYLQWIGEERLRQMGYEMDELLSNLRAISPTSRFLLSDVWQMILGSIRLWLEPHILRTKFRQDRRVRVTHT